MIHVQKSFGKGTQFENRTQKKFEVIVGKIGLGAKYANSILYSASVSVTRHTFPKRYMASRIVL